MPQVEIIYQDNNLLIVNKLAGQIVNAATSHQQESLQEYFAKIWQLPYPTAAASQEASDEELFISRAGMVHRLDKNTSGVLLWAKNPTTLKALLQQFQQRKVSKTYLCLAHGLLKETEGRISLPLARKKTNRQIMAVDPLGREAITFFQLLRHYQFNPAKLPTVSRKKLLQLYQGFSLLQVQPQTGRTHQIRAHLTNYHHPLVGDGAYLSPRKAKLDLLWCQRQFLHAQSISFTHPATGKPLTFNSPLPQDLQQALTYLINA